MILDHALISDDEDFNEIFVIRPFHPNSVTVSISGRNRTAPIFRDGGCIGEMIDFIEVEHLPLSPLTDGFRFRWKIVVYVDFLCKFNDQVVNCKNRIFDVWTYMSISDLCSLILRCFCIKRGAEKSDKKRGDEKKGRCVLNLAEEDSIIAAMHVHGMEYYDPPYKTTTVSYRE